MFTTQTKWGLGNSEWDEGKRFSTFESANRYFETATDLARIVCPMRILNPSGRVIRVYDPEEDMRLPGPCFRMTSRIAYRLWEEAGRPESDGTEFWYRAESMLPTNNGRSELKIGEAL